MNDDEEFEAGEHKAGAHMAAANFAGGSRGQSEAHHLPRRAGTRRRTLAELCAARAETGNILRSSGIPTIEFQASIGIDLGSASFE
jgi:hypothetical protein